MSGLAQQRELTRTTPEETRARIFAAAREVYSLKGPQSTTTREIAERAGVNEATLFRHFGSKTALLDAMKEHYCTLKVAAMQAVRERLSGRLEDDLRAIARVAIESLLESRDLIRVSLLEDASDPTAASPPWRMPIAARGMLQDFMADRVARGELQGDPGVLARFFMGMFFAYVIGQRVWTNPTALEIEKAPDVFVDMFLNGVRKK